MAAAVAANILVAILLEPLVALHVLDALLLLLRLLRLLRLLLCRLDFCRSLLLMSSGLRDSLTSRSISGT